MQTLTLENGQNDPLRISNKIIDSHLRQDVCMVIEFHVQLMSYFVVPRCILLIIWDKAWTTNAQWRLKSNRFEMLGPKVADKCPLAIVKNSGLGCNPQQCSANYFLSTILSFMRQSIESFMYTRNIGRNLHSCLHNESEIFMKLLLIPQWIHEIFFIFSFESYVFKINNLKLQNH